MYHIHDRNNPAVLASFLPYVDDDVDSGSPEERIAQICQNDTSMANYWQQVMQAVCAAHQNRSPRERRLIRVQKFQESFSFELVCWIFAHSDRFIDMQLEEVAKMAYPRLALLLAVGVTSWQAYMEKMPPCAQLRFFHTLNCLPAPFSDSRFSAVPIHTDCYRQGHAHSVWLQDIAGHYQKIWVPERNICVIEKMEHARLCFYMDAKIGILFLFEGKPSLTVSFQLDRSGNIYVHQLQSKLKDRGHYRLGPDWRSAVLSYLGNLFPDSLLYVIDGEQAAKDNSRVYRTDTPPACLPTADDAARIILAYNNIQGLSTQHHEKSGRLFRTFLHTIVAPGRFVV